jgi:hypothetical protein
MREASGDNLRPTVSIMPATNARRTDSTLDWMKLGAQATANIGNLALQTNGASKGLGTFAFVLYTLTISSSNSRLTLPSVERAGQYSSKRN